MKIKHIAVIGGGTAGWLAASHLAVELRGESALKITVIESPDIGIIGVGEGTVPHIKKSLMKFGISEAELLAQCDATFKNGIRFVDWMTSATPSERHSYHHPFSSPYPSGIDVTAHYLKHANNMEFAEVSESPYLSEAMKAPKNFSSVEYEGETNYAYHFNAVKFGQLLAKNARENLGVLHKTATINEVTQNERGEITHLKTAEGDSFAVDFVVDCSGFHALIFGKTWDVSMVDKSTQILTDTALAIQIPIDQTTEIAPYTLAKAHSAGWIWDIPLTTRRGIGFVYASTYMSESEAITQLSQHVQLDVDNLQPRKISMRMGYREKFWHKNAVCLGLAQGFVEPLEATSIFVTDFAAELFARNFCTEKNHMSVAANYCNKVLSYTWERVIDFVQMHYHLSDRRDSDFWRIVTEEAKISDVLAERLAIWRYHSPKKSDFFSRFDLFDVDNFLFVLYGMKFPTALKAMTTYEEHYFQREIQQIKLNAHRLVKEMPGHREWLEKFKQAYAASRTASTKN